MMKGKMGKKVGYLTIIVTVLILPALLLQAGGPPLKENPCGVCHQDFKKILPGNHPPIGEAAKNPCLSCHQPDEKRGEATKFSTLIHNSHKEGGKVTLTCNQCHAL
ncbi:MAG TPA: hypothetical protein PLT64_07225 [Syntrophales bacterium]|nr:hypothetical protein [Syntrophales bacterium]HOL59643.1 hypothetical protein [Syntrophales bacterium]HPO35789.1 hypothetical protein [Syntrophales bacterium]